MAGKLRARIVAAALVMVAGTSLSGCWLQVGNGPEHRRYNGLETALTRDNVESLDVAWSVEVPGTLSEPIVDGNRVFVTRTTSSGNGEVGVRSLDAGTGATVWDANLFGPFSVSTIGTPAAMLNGELWAGWFAFTGIPRPAAGGEIVRLDPVDGTSVRTTDLFSWTPRVGSGVDRAWVQSTAGPQSFGPFVLRIANTETSANGQFTFPDGFPLIPSTPTIADGRVYVAQGNILHAFDIAACGATCVPLWSVDLGAEVQQSTPLAGVGGQVYVTTLDGFVVSLDGATGAELWRADLKSTAIGSTGGNMALADGILDVGGYGSNSSSSNILQAFDADGCGAANCAPLWVAPHGMLATSPPVVAGGVVYVGAQDVVLAFDAAGCPGVSPCSPIAVVGIPGEGTRTVTELSVAQGKVFAVSPSRITALAPG